MHAIDGTEITWKAEKNVTVKVTRKKTKAKGKPAKTIVKEEPLPSFFRFFEAIDLSVDVERTPEEVRIRARGGCGVLLRLCVCVCAWILGRCPWDD